MPCIAHYGIEADRHWSFSELDDNSLVVPIRPHLVVNTVEAAIDAAAVGVARGPAYQCAAGLAPGALLRVLHDFGPPPALIHLLDAEREPLPLKLRTFLDHAERDCSDDTGTSHDEVRPALKRPLRLTPVQNRSFCLPP